MGIQKVINEGTNDVVYILEILYPHRDEYT